MLAAGGGGGGGVCLVRKDESIVVVFSRTENHEFSCEVKNMHKIHLKN